MLRLRVSLLLLILVVSALLHAVVIARYGVRNNNQPFFLFMLVYTALAVAVYFSVPYALWAVLLLALIGIVGLTITFNKPARDKTLDKVIWLFDAAAILSAGVLLFRT